MNHISPVVQWSVIQLGPQYRDDIRPRVTTNNCVLNNHKSCNIQSYADFPLLQLLIKLP